ncbi:MAG TPA: Ig-like domain-containing protein [Gemmatimonadaceae bacterium]|nr:Ig-like domain-containing protein [Gemmatimonadaceae bacterium]
MSIPTTLRWTAAAVGVGLIACASAGTPPGGPERHDPPKIVSISPESGATNVNIKSAEIKFDEVVSDRPSGSATDLDQLFLISPRDGAASVSWHRDRITLKPRKGFRANTAYRITMLPGLADLRGNVRKDALTILFATGASFPPYGIIGRVFDWATQQPARGAYVEASVVGDTTLAYITATDSLGQFDVGPLAAGSYRVRAIIDANSNRTLDRGEKWDTVTTQVTTFRPTVELLAIERDTIAANFSRFTVDDSVTLHVEFDRPLDPLLPLQPALFTLQRPDSSQLEITSVQWAAAFNHAKAVADSVRADSAARARPDTAGARAAPPAPTPPPAAAPQVPGFRPPPPPPKPSQLPPENTIVIKVAPTTPMLVGKSYRLSARGIRNLLGKSRPIARTFTVPKPVPRDTTRRSPTDTTRRPSTPGRPPTGRPPTGRPPTGRPPILR